MPTENERTARLEALLEVLAEKLSNIETKMDAIAAVDVDRRLSEMKADLLQLKIDLRREVDDIHKLIDECGIENHGMEGGIAHRIDRIDTKIDKLFSFKDKMLFFGTLTLIVLTLFFSAFGADISNALSAFFGGGK